MPSRYISRNNDGAQNIRRAFLQAQEAKRGALVGYLMAGDPSPEETPALCRALIRGGVDILELGIPFSDPIADGPTIQAAGVRALNVHTTPADCLNIVRKVKQENDSAIPIVLMTYYNTIFRFGLGAFLSKAYAYGVDGLIVPDLPQLGSSEFARFSSAMKDNRLAPILLASPTTSDERLRLILNETKGFLYLVSLLGVTGVRKSGQKSEISLGFIQHICEVAHDHDAVSIPVAVGFGISEPSHVQNVLKAEADGAIVGSALVNIVSRNLDNVNNAAKQLEQFTRSLYKATYRPSTRKEKN